MLTSSPVFAAEAPSGLDKIQHIVVIYLKRSFVDHAEYDTTSILKLIENRFGLLPLGERDAKAGDMRNAFDF